jgi:hypothetical protein
MPLLRTTGVDCDFQSISEFRFAAANRASRVAGTDAQRLSDPGRGEGPPGSLQ